MAWLARPVPPSLNALLLLCTFTGFYQPVCTLHVRLVYYCITCFVWPITCWCKMKHLKTQLLQQTSKFFSSTGQLMEIPQWLMHLLTKRAWHPNSWQLQFTLQFTSKFLIQEFIVFGDCYNFGLEHITTSEQIALVLEHLCKVVIYSRTQSINIQINSTCT